MDIHVNLEEEWVHLKSGRSTWGFMCYEGVHGDDRRMLRIRGTTAVARGTTAGTRQSNQRAKSTPLKREGSAGAIRMCTC